MMNRLSAEKGFTVHWVLWLITLIVVPVTVSLGIWQIARSDEKQEILAAFEAKRNQPPVALEQVWQKDNEQLAYLPVEVKGQLDNERVIFVANRSHQGKRGYHLISPLHLSSGAGTVFLDRGWLPAKDYSDELPELQKVDAEQTVIAEVYIRSDKDYIIGDNTLREGWPWVAQTGDPEFFQQEFTRLYPHVLRLKPGQPLLKTENWLISNITPEQHMAYAVQWFAIAAVWLLVFISLGVKASREQLAK